MNFFDDFSVKLYVESKLPEVAGKIKRLPDRWNMRCRICGDSKKSMSKMRGNYYPATTSYHCFNEGCNASGLWIIAAFEQKDIADVRRDFIEFIKKTNLLKTPTSQKDEFISEQIINNTEVEQKDISADIPADWSPDIPITVLEYLQRRKIFEAPFYPKGWRLYYSTKTQRIGMPWIKYRKIVFWQTRATLSTQYPKYDSAYGYEKDVFNYDMIDETYPYVFLLEGALDAIWVKNGVAIAGVALTPLQKSMLDKVIPQKVWMLDNQWIDETAKKKTLKILKDDTNCKVFIWPKELSHKDVNELVIDKPEFINKLNDEKWMATRIFNGAKGIAELIMRK